VTDLTGQRFRDYQILRRLGRGAMAEVYLAEQQSLARQVALKVLSRELARDPSYVERFLHEARSAARLVHANIVQVYEVGRDGEHHFIAQEYVPGQNVGDLIHRSGQLAAGQVLDILRQVAAALCKAAEHGIVHRDIKPENLMLARNGEVKVADFGLARIGGDETARTQAGVTMGTPLYMSPEQIEGRPVDSRSDIYSLGVTAYHMLAGRPPFEGDTPLAVAVQHLNKPAPPLAAHVADLPTALGELIVRMMAKNPVERFATPADLLRELRALARRAADEGWAEGPENWSLGDLAAVSATQLAATEQLDRLMKQSRALRLSDMGRRPLVRSIAAGAMLGLLVGLFTRPGFALEDAQPKAVAYDTPLEQLYYAKKVDTEAAWLAVIEKFNTADEYYHHLAMQGLVRYYYRFSQPERAIAWLDRLAKLPLSQLELRTFGIAGLAVAYDQTGNREAADRMRAQMTTDMLERLERDEPQLARLYYSSRENGR
jgi:serine/threonine-protein kinase